MDADAGGGELIDVGERRGDALAGEPVERPEEEDVELASEGVVHHVVERLAAPRPLPPEARSR